MPSKNPKPESRMAAEAPETRGKKPRLFEGMEPRKSGPKAWPSGKPPGGKLPPEGKPCA